MSKKEGTGCRLCSSKNVVNLGKAGSKPFSVTSDSKLCDMQSVIYICQDCSHMQKFYYKDVESDIVSSVYKNYTPHYLSNGNEQLLFPEGLEPCTRTSYVIEKCIPFLPEKGKLLDMGTGNGAVLKSASRLLPGWQLHAFDVVDSYKKTILEIQNVKKFFSKTIDSIKSEKYNLIILWHVLEHIVNPAEMLIKLQDKLTDNGLLLVQVPDIARNPFDFAVIDHYSHFTSGRLMNFFHSLNFEIVINGYEWTHNCLTLLLKKAEKPDTAGPDKDIVPERCFHWLNKTVEYFKNAVTAEDYAIFGTGMASLWVYSQMPKKAMIFIDEDERKTGKNIDGITIVSPRGLNYPVLNIFMPFIHSTGVKISCKLQDKYQALTNCNFIFSKAEGV